MSLNDSLHHDDDSDFCFEDCGIDIEKYNSTTTSLKSSLKSFDYDSNSPLADHVHVLPFTSRSTSTKDKMNSLKDEMAREISRKSLDFFVMLSHYHKKKLETLVNDLQTTFIIPSVNSNAVEIDQAQKTVPISIPALIRKTIRQNQVSHQDQILESIKTYTTDLESLLIQTVDDAVETFLNNLSIEVQTLTTQFNDRTIRLLKDNEQKLSACRIANKVDMESSLKLDHALILQKTKTQDTKCLDLLDKQKKDLEVTKQKLETAILSQKVLQDQLGLSQDHNQILESKYDQLQNKLSEKEEECSQQTKLICELRAHLTNQKEKTYALTQRNQKLDKHLHNTQRELSEEIKNANAQYKIIQILENKNKTLSKHRDKLYTKVRKLRRSLHAEQTAPTPPRIDSILLSKCKHKASVKKQDIDREEEEKSIILRKRSL